MTSLTHIMFDLDGTLIDSAASILSSLSYALKAKGVKSAVPLDTKLIGPPLNSTFSLLTGSDDDYLISSLIECFKDHYDTECCKQAQAFYGVQTLLRSLNELGITLLIVTNKRIEPTRRIIDWLGWSNLFNGIYTLDSFAPPLSSKAEVIAHVIKKHSIVSHHSIYLGDRIEDLSAARINHVQFVAVSWGYGDWSKVERLNYLINQPAELHKIMQSLA